ncbi:septum formation initiator precursor [Jannaschia sp. EhC01]|uniref:Septum formation initiator family protein n=1 Tax=Gymnodinialimonas phycosphaerae TaxID=2841589 RepID=A0A975YGE8_9RHOB|nr:septum formation initiator family protein [Gymnodinialimonas phycosphaerae]MBY4891508.1 septum formation initiator family protein [Gymnodinialimonas phycosphaerae]OAN84509.1 septum formation initiator precursor [Jannaschia sp. EhC01]
MLRTLSLTRAIVPGILFLVGFYFTFAAVQGDNGLFQRIQVEAERDRLTEELARLQMQTERMEILTRRLSDDYLDIDLLDERVRNVLGYARPDELILP